MMGRVAAWALRHRILLVLSLASALQGIAGTSYHQVLLDIKAEFASSWWLVAATVSLYSLATALSRVAVAPLLDRLGEGLLVLPSLAVFCAGSALAAWAPGVGMLAAGIALQGFGIAPVSIISSTLVASHYGDEERGRVLGLSQTVSWIGPMLGPIVGSYMTVLAGWRSIFLVHGFLVLPLVAAILLCEGELHQAGLSRMGAERTPWGFAFAAVSLLGALHFFLLFSVQALLPILVRTGLGLDTRFAGWASLALSAVSMAAFPWGGRISDRRGGRSAALMGLVLLLSAVALLTGAARLGAGPAGIGLLLAGVVTLGCSSGLTVPAHLKLVIELAPASRSSALGTYKLVQYLGGTAGPALIGGALAVVSLSGALGVILLVGVVVAAPLVRVSWDSR
ncbi:MAG TPA: MFS transporter [Symbiobacteriaceae bacterium]|nr:MFS transporter [Symbiobacteriaceae bacterium]